MNTTVFRPLLPVLAVLLSACGQGGVAPEQAAAYSAEAVRLFAQGCVAHGGNAQSTAAWAQQHNLQPLSAEAVKKLPAGMMELDAQAVWQTERNGAVFYLSTAPASCSVKTAVADEAAARRDFVAMAEQGGEGAAARFRSENSVASPFPFRQLVYSRLEPAGSEEILLTANTSPSEHVPAQLALHLSRRPLGLNPVVSP